MTYDDILSRQPDDSNAGSRDAARQFLDLLVAEMQSSTSRADLSDSQRNYLYKLKARWQKRAAGSDQNWNENGSKPGRRKTASGVRKSAGKLDPTVYGSEDDMDPLLKSISSKFGRL